MLALFIISIITVLAYIVTYILYNKIAKRDYTRTSAVLPHTFITIVLTFIGLIIVPLGSPYKIIRQELNPMEYQVNFMYPDPYDIKDTTYNAIILNVYDDEGDTYDQVVFNSPRIIAYYYRYSTKFFRNTVKSFYGVELETYYTWANPPYKRHNKK